MKPVQPSSPAALPSAFFMGLCLLLATFLTGINPLAAQRLYEKTYDLPFLAPGLHQPPKALALLFNGTAVTIIKPDLNAPYSYMIAVDSLGQTAFASIDSVGTNGTLTPNFYDLAASRQSQHFYALAEAVVGMPIVMINNQGVHHWSRNVRVGAAQIEGAAITEAANGDVVALGAIELPTATNNSFLLTRMDSAGNLIWDRQFTPAGTVIANDLIELPDGSLLIAGNQGANFYNSDGILLKISPTGNLIWSKSYPNFAIDCIAPLPNEVLMVGGNYRMTNLPGLMRLDTAGTLDWVIEIDNYSQHRIQHIAPLDSGRMFLSGSKYSYLGDTSGALTREWLVHGGAAIMTPQHQVISAEYGGGDDLRIHQRDTLGYSNCTQGGPFPVFQSRTLFPANATITPSTPGATLSSFQYRLFPFATSQQFTCANFCRAAADFTIWSGTYVPGEPISVNSNTSSGPGISHQWKLIDLSSGAAPVVLTTQPHPGSISVTDTGDFALRLVVIDSTYNCSDSSEQTFKIFSNISIGGSTNSQTLCWPAQLAVQNIMVLGAAGPWQVNSYLDGVWFTNQLNYLVPLPGPGVYLLEVIASDSLAADTMSALITVAGPPQNILGPDTLACTGDTIKIGAQTGFLGYFWNTGQAIDSISVGGPSPDPSGQWICTVTDSTGCAWPDSIQVDFTSCVWPGDANSDLIANNVDLLAIGLVYASTGPVRPNASLTWTGQPVFDWNDTLPSGVNAKHADCDGNGVVNDDDTLGISLNYGLTHNKTDEIGLTGAPLSFELAQDSVVIGDTALFWVQLGDNATPADSVYGLAFTFTYDTSLVDSGTLFIRYDTCWLGQYGQNLLGLSRDFYNLGRTEIAVVRTDHQDTSGRGRVVTIGFVTIDNISGKVADARALNIGLTNVTLIDSRGRPMDHFEEPDSFVVFDADTYRPAVPPEPAIRIWPNPTSTRFQIEVEGQQMSGFRLLDPLGKLLEERHFIQPVRGCEVDTRHMEAGVYLLELEVAGIHLHRTIAIAR